MTEKYQDFIGEDFEGVIKNLLKLEAEKSYEGYKGDALDIAWKRHILILLKNMTKKKKIICKHCGHELWLPGIHRNRNPQTNECLEWNKKTGTCGCQDGVPEDD